MLKTFSSYLIYDLMNLREGSRIACSLNYLLSEKILLLPAVTIFSAPVFRNYFHSERTKGVISYKNKFICGITAVFPGVVTAFCCCSAREAFS
jgi:uncharacterized membrane protein YraQ (UPF0718 family)